MTLERLRSLGEAAALRVLSAVIPRLSRPQILRLARFLARWGFRLSPKLQRVGMANLRLAYGSDLDGAACEQILRESFHSFCLCMLDTVWFSRDIERRLAEWVDVDQTEMAPVLRPAAQICITAHMGGWEILGMALAARGYPPTSVAAPIENPAVDRIFNDLRRRSGQRVVSKHGAVRHLLRALREGGKIALLLDQNTKPEDGGVFVPFFGRAVAVSLAPAMLWKRTGAEVYFGLCLPDAQGRYRTTPPIRVAETEDREHPQAEVRMTAAIVKATEDAVRMHPGRWLWMYKRWKYVPQNEDRERYPYYAKQSGPPLPRGGPDPVRTPQA